MSTIRNELPPASFTIKTRNELIRAWGVIGDGQPGSYLVSLDDKPLCINGKAVIGPKAEILGKQLGFTATVTDVMGTTNWTSFTVYVQEGSDQPVIYGPYQYEVPNDKDTVVYKLQISFV